jgi:hypothetical protein
LYCKISELESLKVDIRQFYDCKGEQLTHTTSRRDPKIGRDLASSINQPGNSRRKSAAFARATSLAATSSRGRAIFGLPRPEPLFLPPPLSLFTVAQACGWKR